MKGISMAVTVIITLVIGLIILLVAGSMISKGENSVGDNMKLSDLRSCCTVYSVTKSDNTMCKLSNQTNKIEIWKLAKDFGTTAENFCNSG